jgi:signal transduction histidine kinase
VIRERLRDLARQRRRFGYRRLHLLLGREGLAMNQKKLRRLYTEEKLQVRRRGGRKRALGTRAPMAIPMGPNQRWSLDFVSDAFTDGRRFRILAVVDDFMVVGDGHQLDRLFQNLIGNAIKYRQEGGRPHIAVMARPNDGKAVFSVQDNGIGIAPEYFDRIFLLFQRLHTREVYEGTGIGLSVCKKIVERHGGEIWVEQSPSGGSTFLFTLLTPE